MMSRPRPVPHPFPGPAPGPSPCPLRGPALVLLSLVLVSCGGRASIFDEPYGVSSPVALAGHVAFLDRTREDLVTVRPVSTSRGFAFEVVRQPVGRNPAFLAASADGTRALVVTHGTAGGPGLDAEEERLYALDPSGAEAARVYTLDSPFDSLDLSADGKFAVAWFSTSSAVNPNELAVVRLDDSPGTANPRIRSLRSYGGGMPLAIRFLPGIPVAGEPRSLALALSEDYVTLFDLEHLDRRDTTVFLTVPGEDGPAVVPEGVVVAQDHAVGSSGETAYVFLRASGLADVFSMALYASPEPGDDQNDFRPVVNEVSVAGVPADFTVFTRPAAAPGASPEVRLLTVNSAGWRSSIVSIVDPRTTNRWDVPLETVATRVLLFDYVDSRGAARSVALLWDATPGTVETRGQVLDLDDVESRLALNLRAVDFGAPVAQVIPTADAVKVLLVHDAIARVSILNVAERTVDRVGAEAPLGLSAMHPDGRALFFARPAVSGMSSLDLQTKHSEDLRLDAPPRVLLALGGDPGSPSLAGRALVVDHGWASGYLTALPLDGPTREGASSVQGFLAEGALDLDTDRYSGVEVRR